MGLQSTVCPTVSFHGTAVLDKGLARALKRGMRIDTLRRNARLATFDPALPGLGMVEPGGIACADGHIVYAGPESGLPSADIAEMVECEGRCITPGLIDCHTQLVHAGDRAAEFAQRLAGSATRRLRGLGVASCPPCAPSGRPMRRR